MKTLIAVPCMDQVPAQFAQSLAMLEKEGPTSVAFQIGSLIYTSRNNLSSMAIQGGYDYIFWLDSDMMFPPGVLRHMIKTIQSIEDDVILSGVYCRRVAPFSPTVFSELDLSEGAHWKNIENVPDEIFECEGFGFGCVLAPTMAFIEVSAKFGDMFTPINGTGEDLSFCWRARQCGWKLMCDPRIELGHVGHHVITRDFWEDYRAYAQEKKDDSSTES